MNSNNVIHTPEGDFELKFYVFTSGLATATNSMVKDNVQNVYTSIYTAYSDIELTNPVGEVYYSGQINSIDNNIIDTGLFTVDLTKKLNLGTFSTTYSYVNADETFDTAAPKQLLNNSFITSGTKDFAFSQGDLIVTDSYGVDLVHILYFKRVKI